MQNNKNNEKAAVIAYNDLKCTESQQHDSLPLWLDLLQSYELTFKNNKPTRIFTDKNGRTFK